MAKVATRESVIELIEEELRESGVEDDITGTTRFSDLDFDSLDAAEMMQRIKDEFGVEIPRQELSDADVNFLVDRVISMTSPT